jgi:hypothetical protein
MRTLIPILLLASIAAADPMTERATKPKDPRDIAPSHRPAVEYSGAIIDRTKPAFVPEFAKNKTTPALQHERDRALTMQPMPVVLMPWGCGWFGWHPYTHGAYGWTPSHGMWP